MGPRVVYRRGSFLCGDRGPGEEKLRERNGVRIRNGDGTNLPFSSGGLSIPPPREGETIPPCFHPRRVGHEVVCASERDTSPRLARRQAAIERKRSTRSSGTRKRGIMKVWFPNFPLRLIPRALKVRDDKVYELVFKTVPSVGKFDLKRFLESVYGYDVEKINTIVYEGKKKRDRYGFYRRPDWKKAYVTLRTPLEKPPAADG